MPTPGDSAFHGDATGVSARLGGRLAQHSYCLIELWSGSGYGEPTIGEPARAAIRELARLLLRSEGGLDEDVVVDEFWVACGQQDPRCRPFLDELAGLARQGGLVSALVEAVDDDVDAVQ